MNFRDRLPPNNIYQRRFSMLQAKLRSVSIHREGPYVVPFPHIFAVSRGDEADKADRSSSIPSCKPASKQRAVRYLRLDAYADYGPSSGGYPGDFAALRGIPVLEAATGQTVDITSLLVCPGNRVDPTYPAALGCAIML